MHTARWIFILTLRLHTKTCSCLSSNLGLTFFLRLSTPYFLPLAFFITSSLPTVYLFTRYAVEIDWGHQDSKWKCGSYISNSNRHIEYLHNIRSLLPLTHREMNHRNNSNRPIGAWKYSRIKSFCMHRITNSFVDLSNLALALPNLDFKFVVLGTLYNTKF